MIAAADLTREVPTEPGMRLDRIEAAIAGLEGERRRVERLGLETPIARCAEQLRYWRFLHGLFAIETTRGMK